MRQLKQLLNAPEGREFLAENRIFLSQDAFISHLAAPANSALADYLDVGSTKLIFAAQQTYSDCTQSMLDRIALLNDLTQQPDVFPFFLWVDTDRAGSDPLMVKFYWSLQGREKSIRLVSKAVEAHEPRFIDLDRSQLQQSMNTLTNYVNQTVEWYKRDTAKEKLAPLKSLFLRDLTSTLSEFNHQLASFVLKQHTGFDPFSVMCSDMLKHNLMTEDIDLFLNHLDEAIHVFNETVEILMQQDIDPQVRPLPADYLPLHYSCPVDHTRLTLRRRTKGADTFAVAPCSKCGQPYQFYLGSKQLSMAELAQTGRWSPDVCLVVFLNDLVSGYVGGKSSTIYYGLVMKAVLEKVFHKAGVPILVPPMKETENGSGQVDGLIYKYLTSI
ncbi:MAG: hypothetical protein H6631_07275 [Anaerolineaceae bacterium]|nr:hypothetical protein [Anaerolineaceae bacterium]MCB9097939.1 hypothetical protein [Anaerolineales bacterium]